MDKKFKIIHVLMCLFVFIEASFGFITIVKADIPNPPITISPGSSSGPGPIIETLTPTFQWSEISNADYYALAISKYPYGPSNVIYRNEQIYSTSLTVPTNTLVHGEKYRWNMQSYNNDGWSAISNTLYFQTQAEDEISVNINSYSATPAEVTMGEDVILSFNFANTGETPWTFYAALSLRRPDNTVDNSPTLKSITLSPGQSGTAQWPYVVDMAGNWDVVFGVWKESSQVTSLGHTGWLNDYITATSSSDLYQLPATSGKISYFCDPCCDTSAWEESLGRSCGTDDASKYWFVAMRWPYYDPCTGFLDLSVKSWWHNRKILVTNPANGKQVVLTVKDWGPCNDCISNCPQPAQERVIDVSKTALDALNAVTDDIVNIEFADQNAPLGSFGAASETKPTVVSRTEWGCLDGQSSPQWSSQYHTVTHIIVHHTATPNTDTDWLARVRQIWDYHTNSRGWGDIGYNYLIDPNGVIYEGRAGGDDVIGAHAAVVLGVPCMTIF